ncbi:MAG: hypothetical protein M1820_005398 [Bogoriella megaspora]|nr:MAG: hypothetical protein M1820_005398 [Bogoriella megaspora]
MAEVIGVISSVGQLIDGTTKLIGYINDTKNASKDAREFAKEAMDMKILLQDFQDRLKDQNAPDFWISKVQDVVPLVDRLDSLIDDFNKQVQPVPEGRLQAVKKAGKSLLWTLKKSHVKEIVDRIERLQSVIGLYLDNKMIEVTWAIKSDTSAIKDVQEGLKTLGSDVEELRGQSRRQRQQTVVDFVAPYDFGTKQNTTLARRQPGTGKWFLDASEYRDWVKTGPRKNRTLWCPGIPGAGKTTMMSIVIDDLVKRFDKDEDVAVAFLYGDYGDRKDQDPRNMLSSLWRHLIQKRSMDPVECGVLERQFVIRNQRPQLDEILQLLFSETQRYSRVYIIIDALDEINSRHADRLLQELRTFQPIVRLLITSRFGVEEDSALFESAETLRIKASKQDLQEYIDGRIEKETRLRNSVKKDPTLGAAIAEIVAAKAQGMFLLAKFHIDGLLEEHTAKKIRRALAELPEGEDALKETYDKAMERIKGQKTKDRRLAERVIGFICYAKRPLMASELQHALSVEPDDEEELDDVSLLPENFLTSVCAGLVAIDDEAGTIRFVHKTTQEYFEGIRSTRFADAQFDMATTCLTYLRLESFDIDVPYGNRGVEDLSKQYAFLNYASLYWGHHVRDLDVADLEQVEQEILDFFEHEKNFSCATRVLLLHPLGDMRRKLAWYHEGGKASFKPLNVAAYQCLPGVVSKLLKDSNVDDPDESSYIHSEDGFFGNALHWASVGNHEGILKTLLALPGTDKIINTPGGDGKTSALQEAVIHERGTAIRLLIDSGANLYYQREDYSKSSCLELAIYGSVDTIRILFDADKDRKLLKVNQFMNESPFHRAARNNHVEALKLMLEFGMETYGEAVFKFDDIIDAHQKCPLHYAAEVGHCESSRLLLDNPYSHRLLMVRDKNGGNPFHSAIMQGGAAVTKVFLDVKGVGLLNEKIGPDGGLHLASGRGEAAVVQLLLQHAPDSLYVNEDKSILHSAARSGSADTVRVILDKTGDALLNRADKYGKTPLHDAAARGYNEVVEVLLSHMADSNAKDSALRTPLHYAAVGDYYKLVKLLCSAGSAVAAIDDDGNSALDYALRQRAGSAAFALLKAGANLPALDDDDDLQAWASAQPWWSYVQDPSSSTSEPYSPEAPADVLRIANDLHRDTKLPKELIRMILEHAEVWIQSTVQRGEQILVNDYHGDVVYLQSQPILGKVRRIVFTITSHDQGWSSYPHDFGTYNGSWTWFSAWRLPAGGAVAKIQGPEILRNVHARAESTQHKVRWPKPREQEMEGYHWHPGEGPDSETVQRDWLNNLKDGDRVLIVAKAKYPGWTNYAVRAHMTIFTSVI